MTCISVNSVADSFTLLILRRIEIIEEEVAGLFFVSMEWKRQIVRDSLLRYSGVQWELSCIRLLGSKLLELSP